MTLPAAPLDAVRAEATPIYGQAADAVTVDIVMTALIEEDERAGIWAWLNGRRVGSRPIVVRPVTDGCGECFEAGVVCFTGETPVKSGGGRVVYPISVQCAPGTCDDCDEVRP